MGSAASRRPGSGARAWEQRHDLFGAARLASAATHGPNWRNGAWTKLIRMRDSDRVPLPVLRRLGGDGARRAPACVCARRAQRPDARPGSRSPTTCCGCSASGLPRAARTRAAKNAFLTISCDDGAAGPRRRRSSSATSACTSSARPRAPARGGALRPLEAAAAAAGLPRLRRQPQAHSRLDPRAAAEPAEVVHRGLPRGRRRALGAEARGGRAPRVLHRLRRAQGRPRSSRSRASASSRPSARTSRRSSTGPATGATRSGA